MQDDPAKLSAALEQLEAERNRRIDEKVAQGKAVLWESDCGWVVRGGRPRSE